MAIVEEKAPPPALYDVEFWDGQPFIRNEDGETISGHVSVAFSRRDEFGKGIGMIFRNPQDTPEGESIGTQTYEGWAIIATEDGQVKTMEPELARATFHIPDDGDEPAELVPAPGPSRPLLLSEETTDVEDLDLEPDGDE